VTFGDAAQASIGVYVSNRKPCRLHVSDLYQINLRQNYSLSRSKSGSLEKGVRFEVCGLKPFLKVSRWLDVGLKTRGNPPDG